MPQVTASQKNLGNPKVLTTMFLPLKNPGKIVEGLRTTGNGIKFSATANVTRDGRMFRNLPHNNRSYEGDWGYSTNSMGKDGQRTGQYARPLDDWCDNLRKDKGVFILDRFICFSDLSIFFLSFLFFSFLLGFKIFQKFLPATFAFEDSFALIFT